MMLIPCTTFPPATRHRSSWCMGQWCETERCGREIPCSADRRGEWRDTSRNQCGPPPKPRRAAPVSSRCLQAPAGDHGPVLNQAIEYRSNAQSAIISAFQLSAIFAKPSTATAAPTPNPHSRQAFTAFPRVRSSEAFRRRPLYWVDRSRRAGIRNPSRKRSSERQRSMPEGTTRRINMGGHGILRMTL